VTAGDPGGPGGPRDQAAAARAAGTRAVVERYLAALGAGDADAAAACVAPDFVNEHTSARGTSIRGRAAYRERLDGFLAQFDDLHYEVEDWIVDGERAAVPYTMTCTFRDGDAARPVRLRGMFRFRVVDGAIVHRVDYWDGEEFRRQIEAGAGR
jgi:steroid delta-isomerase-like uncharacterized protein